MRKGLVTHFNPPSLEAVFVRWFTMTAKEFVKQKYPNARVQRYTSGMIKGMQKAYYLCWSDYQSRQPQRLSEGTSESNAWVNAKARIIED